MKLLTSPKKQSLNIVLMFTLLLCSMLNAQSQLTANFSANIVSGCSPILVSFTDQSTGNPSEWKWDLGNGTISNLQHPSVTYFAPGFYTVKLVVKSGSGKDSVSKINYIQVFQSATVNFTASTTNGCNPFTANFSDQTSATGSLSSWQWDFGDGQLSSQQHPSHLYTMPGSYSVTLKVITANGCISTLRKAGYINNYNAKAAFINWSSGACLPNKIIFQNNSTGSGSLTSKWSFGDGSTSLSLSPVHTYATGGNYTVTLTVQNQFGCIDSVIKNIAVTNPVSAAFTADQTIHCKPPASVHFSNQVSTGNTYLWTFGDSSISTAANPIHNYTDTGIYTVKLVVKNSGGCIDSVTKDNYIKVQKPFVALNNLPDSGCVPLTRNFSVTSTSTVPVTGYLWNFGDGDDFSSTLPQPSHTFHNVGTFDVSVITSAANGCRDTTFMPGAIKVSTKPVAAFTADTRNACASATINFTDHSSGGVTSWLWSFGDNTFSVEQHPSHVYKDTGWMTVQLVALNGGCADTKTIENYIYVKPAVANFNISFQCDKKLERTFNNFSIGANHVQWNFGDGTFSTDSSPVHHYPGTGNYLVTLTGFNDSTHCDYSLTKRVKVLDYENNFFAGDSNLCKNTRTLISTGTVNPDIIKYYWNFGDDTTNTTRVNNITHTYSNAGTYTLSMVTLDSLNCMDTVIKPMYIKVVGPTALFGILNNGGCVNSPVSFLDSSSADAANPIRSWAWNFGDGNKDTLTAPPFVHTYQSQGSFWVSLKLTDSMNCTDSLRLPTKAVIKKPSAWFFVNDSVACPGYPVKFVCPYAESGITYFWDFGDGNGDSGAGSLQSPAHSYRQEGLYTIRLIIRNRYGCEDTSTVINMIRVKQTVASFDMSDSFRTCPPLLIQFTNRSTNGLTEYWNFGDSSFSDSHNPSHFYTYPGIYTATIITKGPGACADTAKKRIIVKGPKGNISYSPLKLCKPYIVNFTAHTENAVSYIWDFNDGVTAAGVDTSLRYTYQDSGSFLPKIILVDDIGCRVAVTGRDTITNVFVKPMFQFPDSLLCNGGSVSFTNTSSGNDRVTSFSWNFGDNTSASVSNPVHQYPAAGSYYPTLSATTATGCTSVYHSPVPVRVAVSPDIVINTSNSGCAPLNATFNAVITSADTANVNWYWNLGNNNTSTLQNPPVQLFSNPGVYNISVTASVSNGCTKTIQKTIEAFAAPNVKINGDTFLCRGLSVNLAANGGVRYKWSPAASLNCDTCATVIAKPLVAQQYIVTGTSLQGCSQSDTIRVNVKQPFTMTYSRPVNLCKGQSSHLEANGAGSYQWYPAKGLSSATVYNPTAKPDTTTNYRVIGTDDAGCFKDTGYIRLTVYNNPTVNAGADKTISAGMPVDLEAVYSSDVTEVRWSPTGDIFRAGTNIITVKPTQNTEYSIEVKNPGGCYASDRVNVIVKFDGGNVFIPNLFSPNNDGVNDVFYPRGKGVYKVKKMAIFSRWGELVFEKTNFNSNDPAAGWDGTFKGGKLPADVFVYVVELIGENGTVLPLKGNVSLMQ